MRLGEGFDAGHAALISIFFFFLRWPCHVSGVSTI
jgi:hypothetical protein